MDLYSEKKRLERVIEDMQVRLAKNMRKFGYHDRNVAELRDKLVQWNRQLEAINQQLMTRRPSQPTRPQSPSPRAMDPRQEQIQITVFMWELLIDLREYLSKGRWTVPQLIAHVDKYIIETDRSIREHPNDAHHFASIKRHLLGWKAYMQSKPTEGQLYSALQQAIEATKKEHANLMRVRS